MSCMSRSIELVPLEKSVTRRPNFLDKLTLRALFLFLSSFSLFPQLQTKMSTEPTTTAATVDAPVTTTADATPVAPATEAAAVTEPTVLTAAPVVDEPATTEAHVADATTTEETAATAEAAPAPVASKSTTSKRLSLLLGKAKTFVDKKVSDKKPAKKEATKEATEVPEATETTEAPVAAAVEEPVVPAVATTEEPVVAESTEAAVPASATTTTSTEEAHTEKPKNEKRKSILGNIFRSKVIYHTIFIICRIRFNSFVVWSFNLSMGFSQRRFNTSNAGVTHLGSYKFYLLWFQPILKL
ncbi:unnamed protein product [Mucor fragilis]